MNLGVSDPAFLTHLRAGSSPQLRASAFSVQLSVGGSSCSLPHPFSWELLSHLLHAPEPGMGAGVALLGKGYSAGGKLFSLSQALWLLVCNPDSAGVVLVLTCL